MIVLKAPDGAVVKLNARGRWTRKADPERAGLLNERCGRGNREVEMRSGYFPHPFGRALEVAAESFGLIVVSDDTPEDEAVPGRVY